jgi:hypothetical protein
MKEPYSFICSLCTFLCFLFDRLQQVFEFHPQLPHDLLYHQGFTIGGARQKLSGKEGRTDVNRSRQIVRQLRVELEDLLKTIK